jgi:hypothetical protein
MATTYTYQPFGAVTTGGFADSSSYEFAADPDQLLLLQTIPCALGGPRQIAPG